MSRDVGGYPNNTKIIVFNIVIALCCIAAIVSLLVGNFFKTELKLNLTKDTLAKAIELTDFGNNKNSGEENKVVSIKGADDKTDSIMGDMSIKEIIKLIPDDFNLEFKIATQIKGTDLASSAFSGEKSKETIKSIIQAPVDNLIKEIDNKATEFVEVGVETILKYVTERAKEMIKQTLEKEKEAGTITQADIDRVLKNEGIDNLDKTIEDFAQELKEPISKLLSGDKEASITFLQENATVDRIVHIAVKYSDESLTQEQINTKAEEIKTKVIDKYKEVLDQFSDKDGNLGTDTIILKIFNMIGLEESEKASNAEASSSPRFESMDEIKEYISNKVMSFMGDKTIDLVSKILGYVGYFLYFVIACWGYVLLKVIFKSIFAKNKTVGLFFPRMFGWIPHVVLVGLPMTAMLLWPWLVEKIPQIPTEIASKITTIFQMMTVSVSSLTWISAACTVILMFILFFYYPERRKAKAYVKRNK